MIRLVLLQVVMIGLKELAVEGVLVLSTPMKMMRRHFQNHIKLVLNPQEQRSIISRQIAGMLPYYALLRASYM